MIENKRGETFLKLMEKILGDTLVGISIIVWGVQFFHLSNTIIGETDVLGFLLGFQIIFIFSRAKFLYVFCGGIPEKALVIYHTGLACAFSITIILFNISLASAWLIFLLLPPVIIPLIKRPEDWNRYINDEIKKREESLKECNQSIEKGKISNVFRTCKNLPIFFRKLRLKKEITSFWFIGLFIPLFVAMQGLILASLVFMIATQPLGVYALILTTVILLTRRVTRREHEKHLFGTAFRNAQTYILKPLQKINTFTVYEALCKRQGILGTMFGLLFISSVLTFLVLMKDIYSSWVLLVIFGVGWCFYRYSL